ncbi:MAG: RT0821/Lpp0805 family surface protein [Pseudomonadota bacterium]
MKNELYSVSRRNIRTFGYAFGLLAVVAITGCSRTTDIAELAPAATDATTTASIADEQTATSDKAVIASTIGGAKTQGKTSGDLMVLSWANEETGNSGTITAIEQAVTDDGERCFSFLTTLENYTGISLYDGKACEMSAGQWVLSLFKPKSAA